MRIGILGGTGKEGRGLALRWAAAGVDVVIGSREAAKAERIAGELNERLGPSRIAGAVNREAAAGAEAVVSTLPHGGHQETLAAIRSELEGKLLLVATIVWPPGTLDRPSAAEEAAAVLGSSVKVVAAFQTVSASILRSIDKEMDEHVLVCGRPEHRREAVELIRLAKLRAAEAGAIEKARVAEALAGMLLEMNKIYGVKSAGIRITGIEPS